MTPSSRTSLILAIAASTLTLSACGSMTSRERDTAVGAAVGGVAGSVLTGGSTIGTVGGAVVGGVIANEINKKK